MKDYYKILGVQKNSTNEDLKKNYLRLAHIYHPDKNGGDDEKFKEINEAYQNLSDYWKRQDYDRQDSTNYTSRGSSRGEPESNQYTHREKQENYKKDKYSSNKSNNTSPKKDYKSIIGIVEIIIFILIIKVVISSSNSKITSSVSVNKEIFTPSANVVQFPKEKCVTENGVKICDLSHSVKKIYIDGTREINFQANTIDCINIATGKQIHNEGNSIQVDANSIYCVSDLGAVYFDPTIQVTKYFNKILRNNYDSQYSIPAAYGICIWTYVDGSGAIPYIQVSDNNGPTSGFDVRAFCKNGDNQIDIYSY